MKRPILRTVAFVVPPLDPIAPPAINIPDLGSLVEETKRLVLELFPDKEGLFDLIYRPRFYRIIESKPIV